MDEKVKKEKKDPKVVVMGHEVNEGDKTNCRQDSGSVVWGALLIFAGVIFLLNTFNVLPWDIWQTILRFWPLLLILGGLNILLGNNPLSKLVLTVLTLGVFFLLAIHILRVPYPNITNGMSPDIINLVNMFDKIKP